MADFDDDPSTKLPPLENWASQTFAYGWLLDRSASPDYSGNASPNQRNTFGKPTPDDIHLLNLNPTAISVEEPIATDVAISQGGGKVVESKGGVIKMVSIRGTTGFLPPIAPYATHMQEKLSALDVSNPGFAPIDVVSASKATGFFEFYRLRRLFRQFMKERRAGKVVQMHYLDFKADEFWMVEPKRFRLERTRFGYMYDIAFDCIEPSQDTMLSINGMAMDVSRARRGGDAGADALRLLRNPLHAALDSTTRAALRRMRQLYNSGKQFVTDYLSGVGVLALKMQSVLSTLSAVQSFFADVASVRRAGLDAVLGLYKQTYSALQGLQDAFLSVTPDAFKADVNEWMVEMQFVTEGLIAHHLDTYGTKPGQAFVDVNTNYTQQRATQGTSDQFMKEQDQSAGSLSVNPFLGASGLQLVGDVQKMVSTSALRPEPVLTGENIFDVAQRLLGDANRFIDLVVLNELRSPYIVSDATNKPAGTIAWGEMILIPAAADALSLSTATPVEPSVPGVSTTCSTNMANALTVTTDTSLNPWRVNMWMGFTITVTSGANIGETRIVVSNTVDTLTVNRAFPFNMQAGDAYTLSLVLFSARAPVTAETRAYGRDIMGVFTRVSGLIVDGTVDVMLSARKDLATVAGLDNLKQWVALCLANERGSDKSNPSFGTVSMIGRKFEPNIVALHVFYVRQALTQDPRIASVERPSVTYDGGALYFTCYIRPVRVQRTLYFRIPL